MVSNVILLVDGIKLAGQFYLPDEGLQAPYPTVCICHGIPAHVHDPKDRGYPLLAERICGEGLAVLIFNFRGSGFSGGNLDILGWTRDLKAAIEYLWMLPDVDKSRLSLLGFSGGAAVSVFVASQDKRVSSVVTCACPAEFGFATEVDEPQSLIEHFRSLGTIRDKDFPYSTGEWLSGFRIVSPINYIAQISPRPLLLVHGSEDEVVAVTQAHRLYERAREPKQIVIINGAGHRLRQHDQAMTVVIDWLKARAKTR